MRKPRMARYRLCRPVSKPVTRPVPTLTAVALLCLVATALSFPGVRTGVSAAGSLSPVMAFFSSFLLADAPAAEPAPNVSEQDQRMLNQVLYRSRTQQRALSRAALKLQNGKAIEGLTLLQELLDQPQDTFIWAPAGDQPVSIRAEALKILARLGPRQLAVYERLFEAEAKRLKAVAEARGDPRAFRELARRFYHTQSGFEAVDWQATRWLDRNDFRSADRYWSRLIADPAHRHRVTHTTRYKADLARRLSGEATNPRLLSVPGEIKTASLSVEPIVPTNYVTKDSSRNAKTARLHVADFSPRSPANTVTAPYLDPIWETRLSKQPHSLLDRAITHWQAHRESETEPIAIATSGILIGNQLVLRDFEQIQAIDAATGRTIWSYSCENSLVKAALEIYTQSGESPNSTTRANALVDAYAGNSILGTLTSDGYRVFAIDSVELGPASAATRSGRAAAAGRPKNSRHVSRASNRLIALDVGGGHGEGSEQNTPAWSVGGVIGAPNWFFKLDRNDDGQIEQAEFPGQPSRFKDIDHNSDGFIQSVEAEDSTRSDTSNRVLAGHFFLGPPLCVDGWLYAVTESDRQINLVALQADTGQLLFSQGIGFVERPIEVDRSRAALACTPVFADGVLICPTQVGIVVGVDAGSGTLLWAYYYGDDEPGRQLQGWSNARLSVGHLGFSSEPLIKNGRVVLLPRQSSHVHCVDLESGNVTWKVARQDGEYIGAVTDELVLVVGRQRCRGLSLASGSTLWVSRLGTPSGKGLLSENRYLLPLQSGRVATINMQNGLEIGFSQSLHEDTPILSAEDESVLVIGSKQHRLASVTSGKVLWKIDRTLSEDDQSAGAPGQKTSPKKAYLLPLLAERYSVVHTKKPSTKPAQAKRPSPRGPPSSVQQPADSRSPEKRWLPGNLVAGENTVFSVGVGGVVSFSQMAPLLDRVYDELDDDHPSEKSRLLAAELELALGNLQPAKAHLSIALAMPLLEENRRTAERLMRELLYRELRTPGADVQLLLRELEALAKTPRQKGRFLIEQVETQLPLGDVDDILHAIDVFLELQLAEPLPLRDSDSHFVSAGSWIPSVIERLGTRLGETGRDKLESHVNVQQQIALASGDTSKMQRFLDVYSQWPHADAVRIVLANRLIAGEHYHRAELLLLQNRASQNVRTVKVAKQRLAHLWGQLGLAEEAASLLVELNEAKTRSPTPRARHRPADAVLDSLTASALRRLRMDDRNVERVRIRENRATVPDPRLREAYERYRRPIFTPHKSTFQLLDKTPARDGRLAVIDVQSGLIVGNIQVPAANSYQPPVAIRTQVGHFFPLGSSAAMNVVSLLEHSRGGPIWATSPLLFGQRRDVLRVGPSGPSYCSFQSRNHLIVVDPADGRIRWQRTDLNADSGLQGDLYGGLFGDDQVLVVFESDRMSYTAYRTQTGEELRRGKLDVDANQSRHVFGRKLKYVTTAKSGQRRLRIWDPLKDNYLLDESLSSQYYSWVTKQNELVMFLPPDRLLIMDVISGETKIERQLDGVDKITYMRAFCDEQRYYVNFQRGRVTGRSKKHSLYQTELSLAATDIQGDLLAIERTSGRLLWKRSFPQRSFIHAPHARMPFLTAVARVSQRGYGRSDGLLVEIVDSRTGRTIGFKDNLLADRILHMSYEPDLDKVVLRGLRSVIDIEFERGGENASPSQPVKEAVQLAVPEPLPSAG